MPHSTCRASEFLEFSKMKHAPPFAGRALLQEIATDIREVATDNRAIATDMFAIATNKRAIETCKAAIATNSLEITTYKCAEATDTREIEKYKIADTANSPVIAAADRLLGAALDKSPVTPAATTKEPKRSTLRAPRKRPGVRWQSCKGIALAATTPLSLDPRHSMTLPNRHL